MLPPKNARNQPAPAKFGPRSCVVTGVGSTRRIARTRRCGSRLSQPSSLFALARTERAIAKKSFLVDSPDLLFEDKKRSFAMSCRSPQPIVGGEVGVQGVQEDILTPLADTSSQHSGPSHRYCDLLGISDATDQPPLEDERTHFGVPLVRHEPMDGGRPHIGPSSPNHGDRPILPEFRHIWPRTRRLSPGVNIWRHVSSGAARTAPLGPLGVPVLP